jgi:hypothetical protein
VKIISNITEFRKEMNLSLVPNTHDEAHEQEQEPFHPRKEFRNNAEMEEWLINTRNNLADAETKSSCFNLFK